MRNNWGSKKASCKRSRLGCTPGSRTMRCGAGTTQMTTAAAAIASTIVSQNRPLTPTHRSTTGPAISAIRKEAPILIPTSAIALVRCCSRVRSARRASTTAAIAPLPCNARPSTTPVMVSAIAATTLPRAKIASPITISGFRPKRSESMPNGIWNKAWVRP